MRTARCGTRATATAASASSTRHRRHEDHHDGRSEGPAHDGVRRQGQHLVHVAGIEPRRPPQHDHRENRSRRAERHALKPLRHRHDTRAVLTSRCSAPTRSPRSIRPRSPSRSSSNANERHGRGGWTSCPMAPPGTATRRAAYIGRINLATGKAKEWPAPGGRQVGSVCVDPR